MKKVYMCFATDILHSGHINIISKAAQLGPVTAGILPNEIIATYDRIPVTTLEERIRVFENIKGIDRVIVQPTLSYRSVLEELRPEYVVHGDDWRDGVLQCVRQEVISILAQQGGELVEFPYTHDEVLMQIEAQMRRQSAIPDSRRPRLRHLLRNAERPLRFLEAHSGLSGMICEKTTIVKDGSPRSFDGMWLSSLCDSTMKAKPDIELVDLTSRLRTADEIMEVTTKPIIFDGDTGGLIEHFVHNIQTIERSGISAVIIEDKVGLKKNSLFGTDAAQCQDSIEHFCEKIRQGKQALKTRDFMLIARIESLILKAGMEDALRRAAAYTAAGADGIMIHSKEKEPDEILTFCDRFHADCPDVPIVVVPTTFNTVREEAFWQHGVRIVIYANHLIRSAYPAMQAAAERILQEGRCKEASDEFCMPIKEIISLF
ncbi:MAG: phosphoenolpyruvate mutase [Clostridiaceae bacterium]|nr:phosphoenolpyruvate mutase [Clostridiaceae bacterium]